MHKILRVGARADHALDKGHAPAGMAVDEPAEGLRVPARDRRHERVILVCAVGHPVRISACDRA
jgi:hypothetical protein